MKRLVFLALLFPLCIQAGEKKLYVEFTDNAPAIGAEASVYLGDRMLVQRTGQWLECIAPKETYSKTTIGWTVSFKANEQLCKKKPGDKYYWPNYDNASGQGTSARRKVRWKEKKSKSSLCQCEMSICAACFKNLDEDAVVHGETFFSSENSLQQTIEYSGKHAEILTFLYSEFNSGNAREAFNREFTLDLNEGNVLGYKGAIIEVMEATNMNIRYKVIRNFQE